MVELLVNSKSVKVRDCVEVLRTLLAYQFQD
jgi:hypothetical protein